MVVQNIRLSVSNGAADKNGLCFSGVAGEIADRRHNRRFGRPIRVDQTDAWSNIFAPSLDSFGECCVSADDDQPQVIRRGPIVAGQVRDQLVPVGRVRLVAPVGRERLDACEIGLLVVPADDLDDAAQGQAGQGEPARYRMRTVDNRLRVRLTPPQQRALPSPETLSTLTKR